MQHSDKSVSPETPSAPATSALKTVIGEDLFATHLDNRTAYPTSNSNDNNTSNNNAANANNYDLNNTLAATTSTPATPPALTNHSQLFDHQELARAPEFALYISASPVNDYSANNHLSNNGHLSNSVVANPAVADFSNSLSESASDKMADFTTNKQASPTPEHISAAASNTLEEASVLLPETVVTGTPIAVMPRSSISMPKLYVQVRHNEPIRGYAAGEDLPLEVNVGQEASSWSFFYEFRSLMRDFFFAGLSAVLLVIFAVQPVKVEGTSMLPKLFDGERIFINKFIYQVDEIQRGDVVVFWYPKNPNQSFIKRVIGIPGDEVRFTNGRLFINNKSVPEPYLSNTYTKNPVPNRYWVVEDHHYFVMGDNRDASNDSRAWGLVPEKYIYGKAFFRYWPLDRFGSLQK
jgi:signal peptidase I